MNWNKYINGGGGDRWNKKKRNHKNNVNMKIGFLWKSKGRNMG
jgi:hypothetical protein